jgi:hypothetical protein
VLSEVGLVRCRAEGVAAAAWAVRLRPLQEWLAKYEQAWNDRLDRVDDYLQELQQQEAAVTPNRHGSAVIDSR